MATKRPRITYAEVPEPLSRRQGCKVGWLVYATREEAEVASKAAIYNAKIDASMGYDFGYCCPGSITQLKDGTWEVCES